MRFAAKALFGYVKRDGLVASNVLFTPFVLQNHPDKKYYLLAHPGILPERQAHEVGKELMETSIAHLRSVGTDAWFVLDVPDFYPRHGFTPTDKKTPYPDLLTVPEARIALELAARTVEKLSGKTKAIAQSMQSR
ncbi:hypothetical protein DS909_00070 [Phaeobacter gallaeciensis]|uniref:N-acetyltransferase domain-containing protein n=2 Tax=Roseobacteraceae TaxID=2854170 RepID=A0A366XA24_9RHOB|nr:MULTISPECIES: hypothetical protein [Roseobacteraceae]MBT3142853.1 hypothetical protein [Falsiruegeria litorea]MBT8167221.1 hypothetical protein [Falsiruegeria litorea]RBW62869.1 hypothetical protein DS909_00070 [Phaeobacter gallaeciensis]